jgi:hypothetical protein
MMSEQRFGVGDLVLIAPEFCEGYEFTHMDQPLFMVKKVAGVDSEGEASYSLVIAETGELFWDIMQDHELWPHGIDPRYWSANR